MTALASGRSRAASAHASRAGSLVREIAKRRDKPYKTEKSVVRARKRKLDLHTSYAHAPPGYISLPVGTPDLAELCKELSRQKGFPVTVVNAQPVSKHAVDPEKVSHHIHRIGYHFRAEVVDQACAALKYTYYRGRYLKEEDLIKQGEQSRLAQTLAKYHIRPDALSASTPRETPQQVRAAIKELFPKIPDDDLESIVKHAWEEGTHRVGNNPTLDLPRRVQLATIARIRHNYTDYDRLLKAFEWKDARAEVEPECLRKLIEWRGENDLEEDDELEEIVRETIVIDDDEEPELSNVSEADDESSVTEVEPGDISENSIEVSHRVAADGDFGAEIPDERSRNFVQRFQPRRYNVEQQTIIAKQKIGAARERMRNHAPPSVPNVTFAHQAVPIASNNQVTRIHVPPDQTGQYRREVNINGERYILAPSQAYQAPPDYPRYLQAPQTAAYGQQYSAHPAAAAPATNIPPEGGLSGAGLRDRPVPSIEHVSHAPSHGDTVYIRSITSESERSMKRRRLASPASFYPAQPHLQDERRPASANSRRPEVVDLTSPVQPPRRPQSRLIYGGQARPGFRNEGYPMPVQFGTSVNELQARHPTHYAERSVEPGTRAYRPIPIPYDPAPASLQPAERTDFRPGHVLLPPGEPRRVYVQSSIPPQTYTPPIPQYYDAPPIARPPPSRYPEPSQLYTIYARHTSLPVHGAPAPVQQAPVDARYPPSGANNGSHYRVPSEHPARPLQQLPPTDGAVAPTQYYYTT